MGAFSAELRPARLLKQIIEALKEVVVEVQFECSEAQMVVQAMDSSHVSLVGLELNAEKFQSYKCDKSVTLGINVGNLAKMLKCAGNDDTVKLTAEDGGDTLNVKLSDDQGERVSEFSMKLIEIDGETLGIPQQQYAAAVRMPSAEFSRVCKDIASFGDTVTIDVKKDQVSFSAQGDIGTGRMVLKAVKEADVKPAAAKKEEAPVKTEKTEGTTAKTEEATAKKEETTAKTEETVVTVKTEKPDGERTASSKDDFEFDDQGGEGEKAATKPRGTTKPEGATSPEAKTEGEGDRKTKAEEGDGEETPARKKQRKEQEKEAEKERKEQEKREKEERKEREKQDKEEREREAQARMGVKIECAEPVSLQFALRYLTMFARAQSVTEVVWMRLAKDIPLQMEYEIALPSQKDAPAGTADDDRMGTLRYYLAPKVGEDGGDDDAGAAPADDE